jgi:peroxiredoxin family protein
MSAGKHVVISLSTSAFEQRLRAALWSVTAASVGESVTLFLSGEALKLFCEGTFGRGDGSPSESRIAETASRLGLPDPSELLSQARQLAPVRIIGCPTEIALAGLTEEKARERLDEVVTLPSFWREAAGARWLTLP